MDFVKQNNPFWTIIFLRWFYVREKNQRIKTGKRTHASTTRRKNFNNREYNRKIRKRRVAT